MSPTWQAPEEAECPHQHTRGEGWLLFTGLPEGEGRSYYPTKPLQCQDSKNIRPLDTDGECLEGGYKFRFQCLQQHHDPVVFPEEISHLVPDDMFQPLLDTGLQQGRPRFDAAVLPRLMKD